MNEEVQKLFNLIDFLHSKVDEFKKHDEAMNRLDELSKIKKELKPNSSYTDKLEYDKVQKEVNDKEGQIKDNIGNFIKTNTGFSPYSSGNADIVNIAHRLKINFSKNDLPTIREKITKYNEFRKQTKRDYFTYFFFEFLDQAVEELRKFFASDTEPNPYAELETETKQSNVTTDLNIQDKTSLSQQNNTVENKSKFRTNEYALAYIFDTYANGEQIPQNRTEGGYNKKELIKIGFEVYGLDKNKDTFYRAVKSIANSDLNKKQVLQGISNDWQNAVQKLSKDWDKTSKYLKQKNLFVKQKISEPLTNKGGE